MKKSTVTVIGPLPPSIELSQEGKPHRFFAELPVKERHAAFHVISERLRTQDNRITAEPMFCLQIKVRDAGYDPRYGDGNTVWIDMESGDYEEVEPHAAGAEEFGYRDRWETVMVAFTEAGLNDYMLKDGHNVKRRAYKGETRIYVESFRRCDEMINIRNYFLNESFEETR